MSRWTIEEKVKLLDATMACIEEHPIVAQWITEMLDRKTENSSEKPNDSTISKMEQVEDEPHHSGGVTEMVEPQKKEVEWVYNKRERLWYPYSNGELLFKTEPETDCAWKKGE